MKTNEKVTIKDVAKKSGFSVATVSAVVNDLPIVSENSKQKILEAIKELGYRPNNIARSLKSSKTLTLGILVRDITNPFYPELVSGIEEVAWSNNYEVFLCNTENDSLREEKYIENLISKRVDGIFITTATHRRKAVYDMLRESKIPYVYVNRKPEPLYDNEWFVGTDNASAIEQAISYLKQMGIENVGFLAGPQEYSTFHQRLTTFKESMERNGLLIKDNWLFINNEYDQQIGYENTVQLLKEKDIPECIFCSSDLMAFGVFKALRELGMSIPDDISVISIDNNKFGELVGLSTVDMNNKELGRKAAKIMVDILNNSGDLTANHQEIILPPKLIIRTSCKDKLEGEF